jgi:hypothetical protein
MKRSVESDASFYALWKGTQGPGLLLRQLLHPEASEDRKQPAGLLRVISDEYARYCDSEEAPKHPGPCKTRAAKYREIHDRVCKEKK